MNKLTSHMRLSLHVLGSRSAVAAAGLSKSHQSLLMQCADEVRGYPIRGSSRASNECWAKACEPLRTVHASVNWNPSAWESAEDVQANIRGYIGRGALADTTNREILAIDTLRKRRVCVAHAMGVAFRVAMQHDISKSLAQYWDEFSPLTHEHEHYYNSLHWEQDDTLGAQQETRVQVLHAFRLCKHIHRLEDASAVVTAAIYSCTRQADWAGCGSRTKAVVSTGVFDAIVDYDYPASKQMRELMAHAGKIACNAHV